jgi:hypothetical protein
MSLGAGRRQRRGERAAVEIYDDGAANIEGRHGAKPAAPGFHLLRRPGRLLDIDLLVGDSALIEIALGGPAIWAPRSGVDDNLFCLNHAVVVLSLCAETATMRSRSARGAVFR